MNTCDAKKNGKNLVRQYISQSFMEMNYSFLPEMVCHLCLIYFNAVDNWSATYCPQNVEICGAIVKKLNRGWESVFLQNIVSSGIHVWNFKIKQCFGVDIGIVPNFQLTHQEFRCLHFMRGKNVYYHRFGITDLYTIIKRCDVVKMQLNFKEKTVRFYKNDIEVGTQYIDVCKFRAGITLRGIDDEIELISYQHTFT